MPRNPLNQKTSEALSTAYNINRNYMEFNYTEIT